MFLVEVQFLIMCNGLKVKVKRVKLSCLYQGGI